MAKIVLKAKALKWGNSYGLRVAKADFERAKLHVGEEVDVEIGGRAGRIDISHIRTFNLGGLGKHHDDVNYLQVLEKLKRTGQLSPAEFRKEVAKLAKPVRDLVGR